MPAIPLPSPGKLLDAQHKTLQMGYPVEAYMGTFSLAKASQP